MSNPKADLLLADAEAAEAKGNTDWKPYREAVAVFRDKGWSWRQIWLRMVALNIVSDSEKKWVSFHSSFRQWECRNRGRMAAAAKTIHHKAA